MAITKAQVDTVVSVTNQMQPSLGKLQSFATTVQKLMASNWVNVINAGGGISGLTVNATVAVADQTTLLNQYTALKTQLVTLFNQLP